VIPFEFPHLFIAENYLVFGLLFTETARSTDHTPVFVEINHNAIDGQTRRYLLPH